MSPSHTREIWPPRSPGPDYEQSHPKISGWQPSRRRILERIGSSLNGEAYKVSDEDRLKSHAVVTVINITTDPKSSQRDVTAIRQQITKLQFCNVSLAKSINLIVGTVTLGSQMCLISPYCPGGSLSSYLNSNMPLSQHQISVILYEVASALWRVHYQGFTHGNIKSTNVLFSEGGTIKLSDFSFFDLRIGGLTHTQRLVSASPHCAAPELLEPKSNYATMDNKMDIWSFGILAYELSTGTLPYADCRNATSLHAALARCGPPRLSPAHHPQPLQDLIARCLRLDPSQRPPITEILSHVYFQGIDGETSGKVLRNLSEEYQEREALRLIARSPTHNTPSSLSPELELLLSNDIPSTTEMNAIQEQFHISERRCSSPFDLDTLLSPPQGFSAYDDAPFDTTYVNTPIQRFLEEDDAYYEDLVLDISCPPTPPPLLTGSGSWTDLPGAFSPGSDTDEASVYSTTHDSPEQLPTTPGDSFEATVPIALRRGNSFTISARASISTRSSGCLSTDEPKPRRDAPEFLTSVVTVLKKLQESASSTNLNLAFQSSIASGAKATSSTTKPTTSSPLWSPFRPSSSSISGRFPPISAPIMSTNSTPIFMTPSTPPPTPATPAHRPSTTVTNNDITPITNTIHEGPLPLTTSEDEKALPPLPQNVPRMVPRSAGQGQLYPRRQSHPRRKSSLSIWPQQKPLSVFHRPNASISNMVSTLNHEQFVAERGLDYTALEVCGPVQQSYFEIDDDAEKEGKVKQEFKRIVSNLSGQLAGSGAWFRRTRGATR